MNLYKQFQAWRVWRREMKAMLEIIRNTYRFFYPASQVYFEHRSPVGYVFFVRVPRVYEDVPPGDRDQIVGSANIELLARRLQREVDICLALDRRGRVAGFGIAVINPS